MGTGSSRHGPRPSRPKPASNRTFSSFFICGASSIEDYPDESPLRAPEDFQVVDKFQIPKREPTLNHNTESVCTTPKIESPASSRSIVIGTSSGDSSAGGDSSSGEAIINGKCLSGSNSFVVSRQECNGYRTSSGASTSYEVRTSVESNFAKGKVIGNSLDGTDGIRGKDVPQTSSEIILANSVSSQDRGELCPFGLSAENQDRVVTVIHTSDSSSGSVVSYSPVTLNSASDDSCEEDMPSSSEQDEGEGGVQHSDVERASPNNLFPSTSGISSRESMLIRRRLFLDSFSRHGRRRTHSRAFVFPSYYSGDLGHHDRWLLDSGGDFFDDGLRADSRYSGGRTVSRNERQRQSRSEIGELLRGGIDGIDRRRSICPSGLHRDGTCSCESILTSEVSSPHASISRIVMLAEALFEVLDEIHHQPESLAFSVVSLPAPESIVDSLPVKNYVNKLKSGSDVDQCHICLAEYEEGDKLRVLPCQHEYHLSCVDKWLKEVHGVCPLCRGDVRDAENSVLNHEIPSA